MTGVWSGVMTVTAERNYWMRRVAAEKAATTPVRSDLAPKRTAADILEDVLYALALIFIWFVATSVILWKSLPGGVEAVPMFLVLEGMYTTCVILAWVKTR